MRPRNPRNVVLSEVLPGDLVGQWQTFGGHHQGDDDLHTIWPVIAGIAKAALVAVRNQRQL
jgi:hypothetical protein